MKLVIANHNIEDVEKRYEEDAQEIVKTYKNATIQQAKELKRAQHLLECTNYGLAFGMYKGKERERALRGKIILEQQINILIEEFSSKRNKQRHQRLLRVEM